MAVFGCSDGADFVTSLAMGLRLEHNRLRETQTGEFLGGEKVHCAFLSVGSELAEGMSSELTPESLKYRH